MNKKGFLLLAGIVVVIFLLFIGGKDEPRDSDVIIDNTNLTEKIRIAHVFTDGMHTFTGEINLPTPCHTLRQEIFIAESYPEQVTIAFDIESEVDACVQMITPEPFVVSFKASKEADLSITLNGKDIPFKVIEALVPVDDPNPSPTDGQGDGEENATSTKKDIVVEKTDFYSCVQNSNCVSVKKGCCGCTAGGSATAINKNLESEWQKKLNCKEIMCATVMSGHPSCFQEPKCVEGKCILTDTIE